MTIFITMNCAKWHRHRSLADVIEPNTIQTDEKREPYRFNGLRWLLSRRSQLDAMRIFFTFFFSVFINFFFFVCFSFFFCWHQKLKLNAVTLFLLFVVILKCVKYAQVLFFFFLFYFSLFFLHFIFLFLALTFTNFLAYSSRNTFFLYFTHKLLIHIVPQYFTFSFFYLFFCSVPSFMFYVLGRFISRYLFVIFNTVCLSCQAFIFFPFSLTFSIAFSLQFFFCYVWLRILLYLRKLYNIICSLVHTIPFCPFRFLTSLQILFTFFVFFSLFIYLFILFSLFYFISVLFFVAVLVVVRYSHCSFH